jgi:hypothetical protein
VLWRRAPAALPGGHARPPGRWPWRPPRRGAGRRSSPPAAPTRAGGRSRATLASPTLGVVAGLGDRRVGAARPAPRPRHTLLAGPDARLRLGDEFGRATLGGRPEMRRPASTSSPPPVRPPRAGGHGHRVPRAAPRRPSPRRRWRPPRRRARHGVRRRGNARPRTRGPRRVAEQPVQLEPYRHAARQADQRILHQCADVIRALLGGNQSRDPRRSHHPRMLRRP